MSPFSDLPSLPGCGRCECGAPVAYRHSGTGVCYASGNYTFACATKFRRDVPRSVATGDAAWGAKCRRFIIQARRTYWSALASATFREEVAA